MEKLTFVSGLERIITANFPDIPQIAQALDDRTRASLAVFCFSRGHLREKGLAIASVCRMLDLVAESSAHVAESLQTHAVQLASPIPKQRGVSLADCS